MKEGNVQRCGIHRLCQRARLAPDLPLSRRRWFGSNRSGRLYNKSIVRNQVVPKIRNLDDSTRISQDLIYLDQILLPLDEHRGLAATWQLIASHFVFVSKYHN